MSDGIGEGGWVALGSVATAVMGGLVLLLKEWWANRKASRKDTIGEWQELLTQQGKQLTRLEHQIDEQQRVINHQHEDGTECQVLVADLYGWLLHFRDMAVRHAAALKRAGQDPGDVPAPPPRPQRKRPAEEAEFEARTTAGNTSLLKAVDETLIPPPEAGA